MYRLGDGSCCIDTWRKAQPTCMGVAKLRFATASETTIASHLPCCREHDCLEIVEGTLAIALPLKLTLLSSFKHDRTARHQLVTRSDAATKSVGVATRLHLHSSLRVSVD